MEAPLPREMSTQLRRHSFRSKFLVGGVWGRAAVIPRSADKSQCATSVPAAVSCDHEVIDTILPVHVPRAVELQANVPATRAAATERFPGPFLPARSVWNLHHSPTERGGAPSRILHHRRLLKPLRCWPRLSMIPRTPSFAAPSTTSS